MKENAVKASQNIQCLILTLILLTWKIWWAPNNASKWQMGFNSAFKGLSVIYCGLSSEFMMKFSLCLLVLDVTYPSSVVILYTIRFDIQNSAHSQKIKRKKQVKW